MAQVRDAFCNVDFVYAATPPGTSLVKRLALYLNVPRHALAKHLQELDMKLPPKHVIMYNDMSTFDFSVQWNNMPTRAAVYGDRAALVAELFPAVRDWQNKLKLQVQATRPAKRSKTVRLTKEQRAEMHRNHMGRCRVEAEKLIPELEVRIAFVLFFCATDSI